MRGKFFNETWQLDGETHERIRHKITKELDNLDRLVANGNLLEINKALGGLGDLLTDTDIRYGKVADDELQTPMKQNKMEFRKRYLIVYKTSPNRKPKDCVLEYLDEDATHYFFNARPIAGTQSLPKSWIVSVKEVSKLVKIRP